MIEIEKKGLNMTYNLIIQQDSLILVHAQHGLCTGCFWFVMIDSQLHMKVEDDVLVYVNVMWWK